MLATYVSIIHKLVHSVYFSIYSYKALINTMIIFLKEKEQFQNRKEKNVVKTSAYPVQM